MVQNIFQKTLRVSLYFTLTAALFAAEPPKKGYEAEEDDPAAEVQAGQAPTAEQIAQLKAYEAAAARLKPVIKASTLAVGKAWSAIKAKDSEWGLTDEAEIKKAKAKFEEVVGGKFKEEIAKDEDFIAFVKKVGQGDGGPAESMHGGVEFQKKDGEVYKGQNLKYFLVTVFIPGNDPAKAIEYRIILEGPGTKADGTPAANEDEAIANAQAKDMRIISLTAASPEADLNAAEQAIFDAGNLEVLIERELAKAKEKK